ncbi:hypothetical protein [Eubacterium coprostanoligenes]|uniref:Uncharacterized protein n=1 Tax=Eubacterium coprostanoligenes TaxID=290054 RepID=A0A1T4KBZ9_9FIRM|nr:hypothetical protein [Eubacterium coprostanoligenes]MCI6254289.1 hypothetical protein [Eubacterium coprostanoligenes]MCI6354499.1 hypothetical protein [Eubacterium coprostanoligenes]MCI6360400.1 hypothetical protein [Eubacterium coprostanoligenes]MCI7265230.1 hypothetical protein [Eubacterium coprostanoligenes]MDD7357895.1 hypothetical protein [Eubacterium coprostanoligenes]
MVSYKGFKTKCITMQAEDMGHCDIKIGDFVRADENGYVILAGVGKPFLGIVVGVNDSFFTVQVSGYAEIKFAGEVLQMYSKLIMNKRGYVQYSANAEAPYVTVLWVSRPDARAGIIL